MQNRRKTKAVQTRKIILKGSQVLQELKQRLSPVEVICYSDYLKNRFIRAPNDSIFYFSNNDISSMLQQVRHLYNVDAAFAEKLRISVDSSSSDDTEGTAAETLKQSSTSLTTCRFRISLTMFHKVSLRDISKILI